MRLHSDQKKKKVKKKRAPPFPERERERDERKKLLSLLLMCIFLLFSPFFLFFCCAFPLLSFSFLLSILFLCNFFPFSIMLCFRPFPLKSNNQKICCHGHSRHETQTLCYRNDPCQCSTSHQVGPHSLEGNLIKPGLFSFNFWVQVITEIKDAEINLLSPQVRTRLKQWVGKYPQSPQ